MPDSARQVDANGYITIEGNPITRVGVFPYLGKSLDPDADPTKIYFVYRPEEELSDPECIASFQMLPIVDDHTMLGPSDAGYVPAEKKGVHGTTGQDVTYSNGVMSSSLKIFSETLADLIENGKTDLSLGYRCRYEKASGIFGGQAYDYIQRKLRGNHLALVKEARCDVSVLDHLTMDHFDLNLTEKEKAPMTPEEIKKLKDTVDAQDTQIKALTESVAKLTTALDEAEKDKDKKDDEAKDETEEEKAKKEKEAKDAEEEEAKKKKDEGMDAQIANLSKQVADLKSNGVKELMGEISQRDALAGKLSHFIGTFDASDKTLAEVAAYGVEKLGLQCAKGQEHAALAGFLHNRQSPADGPIAAFDHKDGGGKSKALLSYLNPKS